MNRSNKKGFIFISLSMGFCVLTAIAVITMHQLVNQLALWEGLFERNVKVDYYLETGLRLGEISVRNLSLSEGEPDRYLLNRAFTGNASNYISDSDYILNVNITAYNVPPYPEYVNYNDIMITSTINAVGDGSVIAERKARCLNGYIISYIED